MTTCLERVAQFSSTRTQPPELLLPAPFIRRRGIGWTGGIGSPLRIALEFENPGRAPTAPATARVEVASFGAFLAWNDLARVEVPAIPPGGRQVVTATAGAPLPLPLTSFFSTRPAPGARWLSSAAHFVGNLNVFVVRSQPVERHLQRAVGLRRGRENLALFRVGDGQEDLYTFSIGEADAGWEVRIAGVDWDRPKKIKSGIIPLSIQPPPAAESGKVSVLVNRSSTGQTVPVEFELEAGSAGTKCYYF